MHRSHLLSVPLPHITPDLPQTLADEQDAVNQEPIGWALDLEVPEESICAEEAQDFVEGIIGFAVRIDRDFICAGGELGKSVGGTTSASSEG